MGSSTSSQRLRTAFAPRGRASEQRKILVLGCMGAGKTTLCRMLAKSASAPIPPFRLYKHTIENHLLEIFKVRPLRMSTENKSDSAQFEEDLAVLCAFRHREDLHMNAVSAMRKIFKSSLYSDLVKDKKKILDLPYNTHYMMLNAERILEVNYIPTEGDLTANYCQTVGINLQSIDVGVVRYELYELPGHHIFRRHWSDYYMNTNVVIFVIDLSDLCRAGFYPPSPPPPPLPSSL
ncbi:hypothetical protein PENTCL1PPCAC_17449 [Pristionchus entomophagus]|uniref:Deoxynucleoside kinase domain-containing protein n=1 Tax=Pristionchus entomophagus TaxID=358040 RepID=A0AAV5TMJ7_9BILA|nr:hypothetical protein PENTCL1PPCAC_17449 [Pristionchus entomophagus]